MPSYTLRLSSHIRQAVYPAPADVGSDDFEIPASLVRLGRIALAEIDRERDAISEAIRAETDARTRGRFEDARDSLDICRAGLEQRLGLNLEGGGYSLALPSGRILEIIPPVEIPQSPTDPGARDAADAVARLEWVAADLESWETESAHYDAREIRIALDDLREAGRI